MKQLLLSSALAMAAALPAAASFQADLDGTAFEIDTVYCHVVGPGVTQSHLLLKSSDRTVHVYTSTLRRSDGATAGVVEPRVIIGKDQCRIGETLSSMAARHDADGPYRYLTGINGDFFIMSSFASGHEFGSAILGYPNMACAIDGKIAAPDMIDITSRENALITTNDSWFIDATDFKYRVLNNDGSTIVDATAINYPRRAGEMMVYNSYMGASTGTDNTGRELVLRMAEGATWNINKSTKFIVDSEWKQGGDTPIPADGLVISCGPSYSNEFIDNLAKGDIVKLKIVISLPAHDGIKPDIQNIIGGDVRILNRGNITREAIRWINSPGSRYQRSVVGFSEDRDMMVFAAVDGSGLTYYESAALLKALGCYDGLDLDGGGSTAAWSKNFGIYNKPRDGSERAIGNGLYFALKAPVDNEVTSLRFADHAITLPLYGSFTPTVYGYNRYGQLVDTDVKGFTLSAPSALGTIDGDVFFADGSGTHALTATLDGMTTSVAVTIDDSFPSQLTHSTLLIDNCRPTPIQITATVGTQQMPVDARAFDWQSSDESVATVDNNGNIIGHADGTATITGTRGETTHRLDVTVQCPVAKEASIIPDSETSPWRTSASGTTVAAFSVNQDRSIALDLTVKNGATHKITLRRAITLHSRPDAISVTVDPGQSPLKAVSLNLKPANSKAVTLKQDFNGSGLTTFTFDMDEIAGEDLGIFPIQFQSIILDFNANNGEYHLDIPSVNAVYSNFTDGIDDVAADLGRELPLTPAIIGNQAVIPFIADQIELIDMTGRTIARAANASAIEIPAAGLYIITATTANRRATGKIIVR